MNSSKKPEPVIIKSGQEEFYIKMLLYGPTGSGKTFVSTRVSDFGPVLYINFETKDTSVPVGLPQIRVGSKPTLAREELRVVYRWLVDDRPEYGVIVLDGMTEFAENLMDEVKESSRLSRSQASLLMVDAELGLPSFGAWGLAGDRLRNAFKSFKALPYHIIFTASEDLVRHSEIGRIKVVPSFYGKSQRIVPYYVAFIGHMEPDIGEGGKAEYNIRFAASPRADAKAEGEFLDDVEPADMNHIFRKILGGAVPEEPAEQKGEGDE